MSISALVTIYCDWPGCIARYESGRFRAADTRRDAAGEGWSRAGGMDFCGPAEEGKAWWSGHAERTDHKPVVKPAGKGYVKLSCTCGWVPERKPWETTGVVTRAGVNFRWGGHVKEAAAGAG